MPQNLFAKHRQAQKLKAKKEALLTTSTKENLKSGEFDILNLSHEGRGVTKRNGKTLFIEGAYPGERVTAELIQQHRHYDELTVNTILKASPDRKPARCDYFGECGGCSIQTLSSQAQRAYKQAALADQLLHFGDVELDHWLKPIYSESFDYRSKARLGVRIDPQSKEALIGFRKKNSNDLCIINACPVLKPDLQHKLPQIKSLIESLSIKEHITHLELVSTDSQTAIVLRHLKPILESDKTLLDEFAEKTKMLIFLQGRAKEKAKPIKVGLDADAELFYSLKTADYPEPINIVFHPQDFTQVNPAVNQLMVNQAITLLELSSEDLVLDLFCGLGNFTLPIARYCRKVIGVEGVEEMVVRAKENALANNLLNVDFFRADLHQEITDSHWSKAPIDKALLDPPRSGALEAVSFLARNSVPRIVYISCNPATLARDAGILIKHGYRLETSGVIDMFPHTAHIESITVFTK